MLENNGFLTVEFELAKSEYGNHFLLSSNISHFFYFTVSLKFTINFVLVLLGQLQCLQLYQIPSLNGLVMLCVYMMNMD